MKLLSQVSCDAPGCTACIQVHMKPTPGMEAGMGMARLVADGLGWQVRMPGEPTRKAEFIDLPGDAPHGEIAQEGGLDLCPAHAEQVQQ